MAHDDTRARLTHAMEQRQEELGIPWSQIANAGGVTAETLVSVRKQSRTITPRTRRAIEAGLRWPRGYVTAILEGKEFLPPSEGDRSTLEQQQSLEDMDLEEIRREVASMSPEEIKAIGRRIRVLIGKDEEREWLKGAAELQRRRRGVARGTHEQR